MKFGAITPRPKLSQVEHSWRGNKTRLFVATVIAVREQSPATNRVEEQGDNIIDIQFYQIYRHISLMAVLVCVPTAAAEGEQ